MQVRCQKEPLTVRRGEPCSAQSEKLISEGS